MVPMNSHPMITGGKDDVFKSKIFLTNYLETQPPNVKEPMKYDYW